MRVICGCYAGNIRLIFDTEYVRRDAGPRAAAPPSGQLNIFYYAAKPVGGTDADQRAGGDDSGVVVVDGVVLPSVGVALPAAGALPVVPVPVPLPVPIPVPASGVVAVPDGVDGVAEGAGVGAVVASGVTGSASCFLQPETAAAVRIIANANLAGTFRCFMVTSVVW
jgi:hypothetical protein